jgi:hypothetical protein
LVPPAGLSFNFIDCDVASWYRYIAIKLIIVIDIVIGIGISAIGDSS